MHCEHCGTALSRTDLAFVSLNFKGEITQEMLRGKFPAQSKRALQNMASKMVLSGRWVRVKRGTYCLATKEENK